MGWILSPRHNRKPTRRPYRRAVRPAVEHLEPRLAPALGNVAVLSGHYDAFLSGGNTQETVLTPANVNPTNFGRLFNYAVDGYTYAQPLYVPNLTVNGGTHNVVFAATEHDSVYAFDADGGGQLWQRSFINPAAGVTTVPQPDVISGDIVPEIGITGTPVIDGTTNTMYVVVKTKETVAGTAHYVQRLHALDITTGLDRAVNGVVTIGDTTLGGPDGGYTDTTPIAVPGTGAGSDGTTVRFNALRENQRTALTLANGIVYLSWASHGDNSPYHGWVVGYQTSDLSLQKLLNTAPNGSASGIWESGGALGVDAAGNLYTVTGNGFVQNGIGGFNPAIGSFSESVLKISTTGQLSIADYFTPTDWQILDQNDSDLGSGGTMLLPDAVGSAAHPHLLIETGKTGRLYLIDRDNMGKNNTPNADQNLETVTLGGPGVWGNAAFFLDNPGNGTPGSGSGIIYYWGTSVPAEAFRVSNGVINPTPISQTTFAIGFPGAQPSISSNGNDPNSAIMWALRVDNYGQNGPAELMAFKAEDLTTELYSSNATGLRDQFGSSVKFTYPVVSNGHVFAGSNGFLSVFGMFPSAAGAPAAPSGASATALSDTQVRLTWANNATAASPATGFKIFRSTAGASGPFTQINTVARDVTAYVDTGLTASTQYWYQVVATNQVGDSPPSSTAVRTRIARPVLQVADVCAGSIDLSWTATANDHYSVKRSTDGTTFTVIATVPASQMTFMDTGLANGNYFYQVTAFSTFPEGNDTADSNVVRATTGPVTITHFVSAGNPGFTDHSDMVANGSAQFTTENLLRLNNNFSQAGSAFTVQQVGIRGFTTSFQVRLHEGTQPNPADGFTFTLEANSPTALGVGGGGLGYQGITHSVAIKFDVFDNEGETNNSTGIFFNGDFPGLPHGPGDVNVPLDPANVNLRSQSTKTITLTYNGTTLTETIHDPTPGQTNNGDFTTTYTVDLASVLGADAAYAGFTGGTGGLFSLQDVLNWQYAEQEANLVSRQPINLRVLNQFEEDQHIDIAWNCNNAYTAQGFAIEWSTDGTNFTEIARVGVNTTSYSDTNIQRGTYYYRVRSFNALGTSRPSNVDSVVVIDNPHSPATIDHSTDFARHGDLTANGTGRFSPNAAAVGTFVGDNDIGNTARAGGASFDPASGTYTLQASGADIFGSTDAFHYIYKPLNGDGEIIARITSIDPSRSVSDFVKAGVMIRETLSAESREVSMLDTRDHSFRFQRRFDPGGSTDRGPNSDYPDINNPKPPPLWLRLRRQGNVFTAFWALDVAGTPGTWTQIDGPQTINMASNVFVGVALTAHNNDGRIATATFDHVTVTGATGPLAPTAARVTDGDFGEAGSVWSTSRFPFTSFTTSFTYRVHPGIGSADGMAFVIQGSSRNALGAGGGGLGYTGIGKSVAVKFDFYTANTHKSTTGLYLDGEAVDSPAGRAKQVFMDGAGIDFNSGHVFRITFTYDTTNVLHETVTDTVTGATFATSYTVDIGAHVGGNVAYVGFTGGTGGQTATQDILTWNYQGTAASSDGGGDSSGGGGGPTSAGSGPAGAVTPGQVPAVAGPALVTAALTARGSVGPDGGPAVGAADGGSPPAPAPAPEAGVSLAGPDTLAEEVGGALLWWGRPRAHRDALDQVFSQDLFEEL